ncbi:hypothetical protein Q6316_30330, partial [Klebsiella pneumoniae]|uniref:hypothetical protein n=1 Tax=Klebsiella pneumoniae TaxID=573 RepID=UPI0027316052
MSFAKTMTKELPTKKYIEFYHFLAKLHLTKGTTIGVLIPDTAFVSIFHIKLILMSKIKGNVKWFNES